MWIPLTVCRFRLRLRFPYQLNVTIHMSYDLFVDPTNFFGFRKYFCGFRKFVYFWSNFEPYNVLGLCFWVPKQERRSKKNSHIADFATNLILACSAIRLNAENHSLVRKPFMPKTEPNLLTLLEFKKPFLFFGDNWNRLYLVH